MTKVGNKGVSADDHSTAGIRFTAKSKRTISPSMAYNGADPTIILSLGAASKRNTSAPNQNTGLDTCEAWRVDTVRARGWLAAFLVRLM
ncbi:MAG: hypothetical protein HF978_19090 [Desulfobacteraceae bacterium]|nr:hypothetical protein [Desulfobacteraceae bacterium]MBC2757655.1 hypothetical protein [Desulfobacteraceae bacterium]